MKITFAHCNLLDGNENMILQKNVNIIVENEKIVSIDKDNGVTSNKRISPAPASPANLPP